MRLSYLNFCALICTLMLLVSCSKTESTQVPIVKTPDPIPQVNKVPLKLAKLHSWNTATGQESLKIEYFYNDKGLISRAVDAEGFIYTTEYNSKDLLIKIVKSNSTGWTIVYDAVYNDLNQLIKNTKTDTHPVRSIRIEKYIYDYYANGKIFHSNADGHLVEHIWNGENTSSMTFGSVVLGTAGDIKFPIHDDKINPFKNIEYFDLLLNNAVRAKNNYLEIVYNYPPQETGAPKGSAKIIYKYNENGYPVSSVLEGGSTGTKYYYY